MFLINEKRLTVAIVDLIISEGLTFNLAIKSLFKKLLNLKINVSKGSWPPNRKLISKDNMDVIHDYIIERKFRLNWKESDFLVLFIGDGDTITITPHF